MKIHNKIVGGYINEYDFCFKLDDNRELFTVKKMK